MRRIAVVSSLLCAFSFAACSTAEQAPEAGQSVGFSTSGGVLSLAPEMAWGESVTGRITDRQLDLWAFDAKAGDELTLTETVTDGDLAPDAVLYLGGSSAHISSESYDVGDGTLSKTYELTKNGRYLVVVRAYQGEGEGGYSLSLACNGGPCAGENPPPATLELDRDQIATCVMKTRLCAMDKLPVYNGAVGPVTAKKVVDECLAESFVESDETDLPVSCENACASDDSAYLCNSLVEKLPWFADASPTCLAEWDSCMGSCYFNGSYYEDSWYDDEYMELYDTVESICAHDSMWNGNCWSYVNSIQSCGGEHPDDSTEACLELCYGTTGAFIDDLDSLCSDECY